MRGLLLLAALAVALLSSPVLAAPSSKCLSHDRAAKTWPTRELTRDDDGCWTYWRKGLGHELPPPTDVAPADTLTATDRNAAPEQPQIFAARWVEIIAYDPPAPRQTYVRDKHPNRQYFLAVLCGIMLLCGVEAMFAPKIHSAIWRERG